MKTNNKERLLASSLMAGMAALGAPLMVGGAVLGIATDAHAQQSYTSQDLTGRVVDSSGSPITGATVTAVSDQGVSRSSTTGADGAFRFAAVPGGEYSVTVTASGFDTADTIIQVAPGSSTFAFTLARAGSDEIVVTAARVRDFNRTDTGTVFNVQELATQIPLGRSINAAVLLTPSASLADASIAANGIRRNQSGVSLSGTSAAESVYYVNGLNVTDQRTFLGYADLPFDFIQTIETKTGGYAAEFGRGTGGVVNIVTRSGSNEFHWGVSASYSPDSLRSERGLAWGPGGNNSVGQQIYNQYAEADAYEGSVWASGPIIHDHLFLFGIYNARYNDNWGAMGFTSTTTANGSWTNSTYNDPRYGLKLDFVINPNHRIEWTYFNDEATTDYKPWNVNRSFNITPTAATRPDGSLLPYWQQSGGETNIVQYTGVLTDWFTLSALYGHNESGYLDYGPYISQPGILDYGYLSGSNVTLGRQAGPFNLVGLDERETYRVDADFRFSLVGEHHLRVGYDREDLTSTAVSAYTGGGLYYAYDQASCPTGAGADGCVEIITFANIGEFEAEQSAWYVQDSWELTDNFSLQLGVRADIYDYLNSSGESYIKIDDQIAPRLGFTWDLFGDNSTRLTGSFGDYYLPIALNTSIRASSGEVYTDAYYQTDRTGTCLTTAACAPLVIDSNGFPTVGAQIGSTIYYSPPGGPDPKGVAEADLNPMYERAFTLGLEHDFTEGLLNGWTLGVTFTHRNLESTIEDTAIGDAIDRYCARTSAAICGGAPSSPAPVSAYPYVLINPGDGARVFVDMEGDGRTLGPGIPNPAFNPVWVNLTAADLALPEAERKYDAMTLTFERPFDGHWGLTGSYTLAHSQGNYEGAVKSDIGQTDTSITQDFDHAANELGAYGDLPNDHRHTLRLYGTYRPWERFTIGANFSVQSGRPYGCIGYVPPGVDPYAPQSGTPSGWYCPQGAATGTAVGSLQSQLTAVGLPAQQTHASVATPRGSMGETDWVNQLDLSFAYRIFGDEEAQGGPGSLTATLDVFNVFDGDAVTRVVEQGEVRAAQHGVQAPFYGMPRNYQGARSVRLGLRYAF